LPRRGNLFFDGARPALSGTSRVCAKFREELLIEDAGEICVWRRRTFARGPSEPARSPSRPPELSCGRKFTATRTTLLNSARPSPRTTLPIHLDALRAHRAPPSRRTLKIRSSSSSSYHRDRTFTLRSLAATSLRRRMLLGKQSSSHPIVVNVG